MGGAERIQASVRKLLSDEELALMIDYLAYNPAAGDLIPGTGGVRKLRWGLEGRGKRAGVSSRHPACAEGGSEGSAGQLRQATGGLLRIGLLGRVA